MSDKALSIKERAFEKINSLQKLEPDFVLSWLGGLTDLEQKIVSVMYIDNKALTIKDVIVSLIRNTHSVLTTSNYPEHIRNSGEFNFPFCSYYPINDEKVKQKISSMLLSEAIILLKKEIKFPSFRRIDKSIQDLISMNIVNAREGKLENEKIKGLYYLNPIIRSQLNKLKTNK